jgi:pimeloyl-ACP methyl ester carboxylesterase
MIPERDAALGGSTVLMLLGAIPDEPGVLLSGLRDGYSRMAEVEGSYPSPVLGTYVNGQTLDSSAMLRIAPERFGPPEASVPFLHGSGGNVSLFCWQVAQAAFSVGLETVCPSTDVTAFWNRPEEIALVDRTIRSMRARGVRRIYLAGLSQGGIGVSQIASRFDVQGVILISGVSSHPEPVSVPTLILQGALDPRTTPEPARAYAEQLGVLATYREWDDASHWLLLTHHAQVTQEMTHWLAEREGLGGVQR